jgi:hypothetical protein
MSVSRPQVAISRSEGVPPSSLLKNHRVAQPLAARRLIRSYHITSGTSLKRPSVLGRACRIGARASAVASALPGASASIATEATAAPWISRAEATLSKAIASVCRPSASGPSATR